MVSVKVVCLSDDARMPTKGTDASAGWDLYIPDRVTIQAFGRKKTIPLDIAIEIPKGYCAKLIGRSHLASHYGIDVLGGLIDSDYRGIIKVILINHGMEDYTFDAGDRICQMLIEPVVECSMERVSNIDDLSATPRGTSGFGHTGR